MKRNTDASPARTSLAMSTKLRGRRALTAVLAMAMALLLALPAFSSAESIGSATRFKGLRTGAGNEANPLTMASGPDGNAWFIDNRAFAEFSAIGKLAVPSGTVTEYIKGAETNPLTGLNEGADLVAITAAPKGEKYLWFTDRGTTPAIGVIDSASPGTVIKECSIAGNGGNAESQPEGIVAGPDGNLWFADKGTTKAIGMLDPSNCKVEEFTTGLQAESQPMGIVAGSDGKLWFTDQATGLSEPSIGTIDPSTHKIEEFSTGKNSVPGGVNGNVYVPNGIIAGPDGNVWFTEGKESAPAVCRINVSSDKIDCFNENLAATSRMHGITSARGKLWVTDESGNNEKQVIKFAGTWANGNKFELCNESKSKCVTPALGYSTVGTTLRGRIKTALEEIYGAGTVGTPTCTGAPATCSFSFAGDLAATNVGQTSCKSLIEPTGTCSTETATQGVPHAVDRVTTSGKITRYPVEGVGSANPIVSVPGDSGNVWAQGGTGAGARFVKFGIEAPNKELKVVKTGKGSGTVTSSPVGINCGSECSAEFEEAEVVTLTATAAKGSAFVGWTGCESESEGKCLVTMMSAKEVTAEFETVGPTNLRELTLTKSAGGVGGIGTVQSKPKGIKCGPPCNSAIAEMYANETVVLKAKASTGSTIASWSGCESSTGVGGTEGTCTVKMPEAHTPTEVKITWSGTSKAIVNPQALTVSKGESSGKGTVKGTGGLGCETECTSTTVLYQGETGVEPKIKPGKTVVLKAAAAFGSEFSGFSPNCTEISPTECSVVMNEAEEVSAEFTAKPTTTLTVNKAGTGTGTVSSKPKAINCGATCTTQDATVPTEEAVILKEKPGTGMVFEGWSGGGCSGKAETCTVSLSEATTVTAEFSGAPKAIPNAKEVTLAKAGSGYGTVKAAGLTCEALCTSTVSLYQGETGVEPKIKPGKTVIFKAVSAPGSQTVEWSGCTEINPTECSVTVMNEDIEVTAKFDEIP